MTPWMFCFTNSFSNLGFKVPEPKFSTRFRKGNPSSGSVMNITIDTGATLRPAMLFSEECLDAHSAEIELGDIPFCHGPPKPEVKAENEVRNVPFRYLKPPSAKGRKFFQRSRKKMRRQNELQKFLDHHKFQSVNHKVPLASGELVCPIHLAAFLGRPRLLRLILNHGVDPQQKSSHGRTALDMARGIIKTDAMCEVIELLTNPVQTCSMRNFFEHMGLELPLRTKHKVSKLECSAEASTDLSKRSGKKYLEVIVHTVEL